MEHVALRGREPGGIRARGGRGQVLALGEEELHEQLPRPACIPIPAHGVIILDFVYV
jgi:hypothetical protein